MTGVEQACYKVEILLDATDPGRAMILQQVGGRACIPGPTFKGAFRGAVEKYFAKLASRGATPLTPCVPVPPTAYSPVEREAVRGERLREACVVQVSGRDVQIPMWKAGKGICPACTLFGAQGLIGFIRCGFLRQKGEQFEGQLRVVLRDESRGWKFGKPRTIGNMQVDILDEDGEKLLQSMLEVLRGLQWMGAVPKGRAGDPFTGGRVRVAKVRVERIDC